MVYRIDMDKRTGLRSIFSRHHIAKGHYMLVDGEHVRTEEPHDLNGPRRGLTDYLEPLKAQRYARDFENTKREIMKKTA